MDPNSLTPEQKNQLLQRMQLESQQQRVSRYMVILSYYIDVSIYHFYL